MIGQFHFQKWAIAQFLEKRGHFWLFFCNNFVTFLVLWPEKVGKWPVFFQKWAAKNVEFMGFIGICGQKPSFFF